MLNGKGKAELNRIQEEAPRYVERGRSRRLLWFRIVVRVCRKGQKASLMKNSDECDCTTSGKCVQRSNE